MKSRTLILTTAVCLLVLLTATGQGVAQNPSPDNWGKRVLFVDQFYHGTLNPEWQTPDCCEWVSLGWLYLQDTNGWPRDAMVLTHDADQNWKNYTFTVKAQFVQTGDPNGNEFNILVRTNHFARDSEKCTGQAYQITFNGVGGYYPSLVMLWRSDYDIGGGCYGDSFILLAKRSMPLSLGTNDVKVTVLGPRIQLWIEGDKIFDVTDPNPFLYGGVGLHTNWELSSRFDDVQVVSEDE